jgi:hypothetical protein
VNDLIAGVTGYIYQHPALELADLQALLERAPRWAYTAGLYEAQILPCASSLPKRWPEGRAFGADVFDPRAPGGLEVRWVRLGDASGRYRVIVLTEDEDRARQMDAGWVSRHAGGYTLRRRTLMLWGELDRMPRGDAPPAWIEMRIPHPLNYPIEPRGPEPEDRALRVYLEGYDYALDGVPVTTRWAWLRQGKDTGGES